MQDNTELCLFPSYPDIVSINELSQMLCISTKTAYRLLQEKQIGYFRIGKSYKIPKRSILQYIEQAQAG